MKILAIIQARMGSTRLQGKVMRPISGIPLIAYQLERIARSGLIDQFVVATTANPEDDVLAVFCQEYQCACFRGSETDVLSRFVAASEIYQGDVIVRMTGDCPIIDPICIDDTISAFLTAPRPCDYLSNTQPRLVPRGYDVEVFSKRALLKASTSTLSDSEKEHVTLTYYRHPETYSIGTMNGQPRDLDLRLTVDTLEDFELIEKIIKALYPKNRYFDLEDVSSILRVHPEWLEINSHIQQKQI